MSHTDRPHAGLESINEESTSTLGGDKDGWPIAETSRHLTGQLETPQAIPPVRDDTAIYDITQSCLELFERLQETNDGQEVRDQRSPPIKSDIVPTDAVNLPSIAGLHNSFIVWIHYTGALSLQSSSLDARLRGFVQVWSMVDELLQMVLRNLEQRECAIFPDTALIPSVLCVSYGLTCKRAPSLLPSCLQLV